MLKLFVVCSNSPKPEDWNEWDEIALILAHDQSEALQMAKESEIVTLGKVAEIDIATAKPGILYAAPSPELWYGDDV